MSRPWLFRGTVAHTRLSPQHHAFHYPAFFLCFPLQRKDELKSRLFSINRFNLFSYHDADHAGGRDADAWIRAILSEHRVMQADGEIWLLALPRMLGFVFNPVSFWLCHDKDGKLRAIVCEVNNTFGERHCYLLEAENAAVIDAHTELKATKIFHVSPFFDVKGEYRFRFLQLPGLRTVSINYLQEGKIVLKTAITGEMQPLDDRHLLRLFFSLGWSTLMVVLRIHWQALRLWMKGARFHRKPLPPAQEISR